MPAFSCRDEPNFTISWKHQWHPVICARKPNREVKDPTVLYWAPFRRESLFCAFITTPLNKCHNFYLIDGDTEPQKDYFPGTQR